MRFNCCDRVKLRTSAASMRKVSINEPNGTKTILDRFSASHTDLNLAEQKTHAEKGLPRDSGRHRSGTLWQSWLHARKQTRFLWRGEFLVYRAHVRRRGKGTSPQPPYRKSGRESALENIMIPRLPGLAPHSILLNRKIVVCSRLLGMVSDSHGS